MVQLYSNMFKLPNQKHKKVAKGRFSHSNEEACPGTPLYRKKLDQGVQAEANDDGTIFISETVEPGSAEERKILMHEMQHLVDMRVGKLSYTDDDITWMGETYERKKGKINYNGKWLPEGSTEFPWERH